MSLGWLGRFWDRSSLIRRNKRKTYNTDLDGTIFELLNAGKIHFEEKLESIAQHTFGNVITILQSVFSALEGL